MTQAWRERRRAHEAVTWKMESDDLATGRVVMGMLFSAPSHSWMVTMLRAGGGMCRCVSRAFFRWWKSPSVRVYLGGGGRGSVSHRERRE